jgi:TonB-dependent receptor
VARLGYYRSILRPDVQNIARSLVINDTSTLLTTANPNLKPEYASNLDARLEYYFEPVGVFSAGIFSKKIQDIQYTTTTDFTLNNVPQDILDLGYTPAALVASSAQFARIDNGPSTTLWGYEFDYSQQLSFLRGVFGGLGVFANYSYTQMAEEKYFTGASGVTKETFNAGINLRARAFEGQVKFNWVGDRLLAAPGYTTNTTTGAWQLGTGSNAGRLDYEAKRLQIDINADYKFSPRATLFLNIANLTGAPSVRYGSVPVNLIRHGGYGAKYTFGMKGSF